MNSWLYILIAISALGGLLMAMAVLQRFVSVTAEVRRKAVHVLMGLCCLSFPMIFDRDWPVVIVGVLSVAILLIVRRSRGGVGDVLHGVGRDSLGDVCFPVAVTVLFLLMENPVTDFYVPLLVLTLADAVGALVGIWYGKYRYTTDEGSKSFEGSMAFFVTAFLSTHIPLLLFTDLGRLECLLIGSLIGLLVMMLEAIAWQGLDNLFVPLGTYTLLQFYPSMSSEELAVRLMVLAVMMVVLWLLRKFTYANDGTIIAGVLLLYLIWVVGGVKWLWPPLVYLVGYCLLCPPGSRQNKVPHRLADLGAVVGVGIAWLFLFAGVGWAGMYWSYLYSWAAQLGMVFCAYSSGRYPNESPVKMIAYSTLYSGLFFAFPVFGVGKWPLSLLLGGGLLGAVVLSAFLYWKIEISCRGGTQSVGRPQRQFLYGLIASCIGFIYWGI